MIGLRWLRQAVLLGGIGLCAAGCPAALDDNFTLSSSAGGSSSRGGLGSGAVTAAGASDASGGSPNGLSGEAGASTPSGGTVSGGTSASGGIGTSGESSAGAGGAAGPCACQLGETCCDGECVNLRFDSQNCRSCGSKCPGTTCDGASCTNTCAQGFIDCNHNVVDGCEVNPGLDPKNCGNCGIACGFQLECVGGNCVCPKGTADCDGNPNNGCETDTSSDAASCGGCGKACGVNQGCAAGACGCADGFADCNQLASDGCEASLTGTASCGSCSLDCGQHGICVAAGQCGCLSGYLDCDAGVAGCETPTTDPKHCGSCASVCPPQTPACDGVACSVGCGGLTKCGASCVDTQTDQQNCGSCGKLVGANQICAAGKPKCLTGYADCDGNPSDCEVNTDTDGTHCGNCVTACKSGALCSAGSCECAPTTPNDCGSTCAQCCNSAQCSDGNSCTADTCNAGVCSSGGSCSSGGLCCAGTGCFGCCGDSDCTSGKICTGNQCVTLVCTTPQIACNSKCVNPTSDAANCGGCGNSCGVNRTCSTSACTPKWVAVGSVPAGFVAREKAAYAALGSKVFVWGGSNAAGADLSDGAIYDPGADSWSVVGTAGSPPSARVLSTAVWTGSVVVVWGGGNAAGTTDLTSGGRYDPVSGTWQTITLVGAPQGLRSSYGFWTGSRVLFYGGVDMLGTPSPTLSLYDPTNDKWYSTTTTGRPLGRTHPTIDWSGSLLVLYGGQTAGGASMATYTYNPATNAWFRGNDGPSGRFGAFGAWDGTYLSAWSGNAGGLKNDGGYYEPNAGSWLKMTNNSQPAIRWAPNRQTGWSARVKPGVTLMLGGLGSNATTFFTDGATYSSTANSWSAIGTWPSGNSHLWGVGVWTGSEFVVWGGRTGTGITLTASGERYRP